MPDSSTMEDWRRTDVSHIDPRGYRPVSTGPVAELSADLAEQGVIISSLEAAASEHPELVEKYLDHEVVPANAGKFAALNAAFWRGGGFVYVPRGVTAAVPVWAPHGFEPLQGPQAVLPRSLVVGDEGASLIYTDDDASPAGQARLLRSTGTEAIPRDRAHI